MHEVSKFISYNSYLFWVCADIVIRRFVLEVEMISILEAYNSNSLEIIMEVCNLHIRSYNVVTIGPPFTKICMIMLGFVTNVKGMGTSQAYMNFQ